MDKKDIYEHLAKIYLDASLKRKNKTSRSPLFKNLFYISSAAIFLLAVSLIVSLTKNKSLSLAKLANYHPLNSELTLLLQPDIVKINFNFDPAKKESYTLFLNKLNAARFSTLGFSVKNVDYQDNVTLRVEFSNIFKEKSEVYIRDISHKWQEYKIPLSDFKYINDWSEMLNLSFVVEEWNARGKKGIVYLDNIRLLK